MALWDIADTIFIDGTANGLGYLVKGVSWVSTRLQTGNTPMYAMWMVVGAVALFYFVVSP